MAAETGGFRQRAAQAGRRGELILGPIAAKDLPHFEECGVREPAIGIFLRGGHEPRNKARPHVGKLRGNRIGERQLGLGPAEQVGVLFADEGPGHRLDQVARGKGALGLAGAQLDRREHRQ